MNDLPKTWTVEKLGALGTWSGGGTPNTETTEFWSNGTIPWISPKDMKQRRISTAQDSITSAAIKASATNLIPENSVLIVTRSGILRHSLPVATNTKPVTLNQDMKALMPGKGLDHEFLYFALLRFAREILHQCCKAGTTVQSIETPRLLAFEIPIPPTNEQRRIVAKIEELFPELDEGVANLQRAKAQLAVYRQALLKHAFEGKLTAEWRETNPDKLVTWRPTDIPAEELNQLPALPLGWSYARFGRFIASIDAGKSFSCDERPPKAEEVGVAKVSAVTWGDYDETESKTCIDQSKVVPAYFIREGDFLISRANTIELVGACVVVRRVTRRIMLSDKTLRLAISSLPKEYFLYFLRSCQGRREIESRSTGNQESMRNIGQERIRSIIVPICLKPEADEIVRILEEQFTALGVASE